MSEFYRYTGLCLNEGDKFLPIVVGDILEISRNNTEDKVICTVDYDKEIDEPVLIIDGKFYCKLWDTIKDSTNLKSHVRRLNNV